MVLDRSRFSHLLKYQKLCQCIVTVDGRALSRWGFPFADDRKTPEVKRSKEVGRTEGKSQSG